MILYCGLSVDSSCYNLDNMGSNLQLGSGLTQSADSSERKIQHINHSDSSIEMYINIIDNIGCVANGKFVLQRKEGRGKKKKFHLCPCQWR